MSITRNSAAYIGAFVDELVRSGVSQAVVSPGSRSTPLAMMLAEHPHISVWMHVDERSAGFFALGMAKATHKPVALVCSSGTAAANYYPAVVEAYQSRIPLLVLTADRPHELRDVGAPQAINQIGLYGGYAKWFMEMALPEASIDMLRYVRTVAARSAATAIAGPAGPVHLNFPLREPLVPDFSIEDLWEGGRMHLGDEPYASVSEGKPQLGMDALDRLSKQFKPRSRGLIVCGPIDDPQLSQAVVRLAGVLGVPVLADPLSQIRSGHHDKSNVIDTYDTFLRNEQISELLSPEWVIRIGAMPVSKAFLLFLKKHAHCRQLIVDPDKGWRDPTLHSAEMVYADPVSFCLMLADQTDLHAGESSNEFSEWLRMWNGINEQTRGELLNLTHCNELFEGQVFLELAELLPNGSSLFVGNSMPIRDLDTYFFVNEHRIRTFANRGANGIDGVVSTALGVGACSTPLVLVIGDLSFYHDMNGLLAAKLHRLNATIILLNNDGGGIFSFLSQADHPKHFERLFGTPIGLDFRQAAELYEGKYTLAQSWSQFREEVKQAVHTDGLKVIELRTDRSRNVERHRSIFRAVGEHLVEWVKGRDTANDPFRS